MKGSVKKNMIKEETKIKLKEAHKDLQSYIWKEQREDEAPHVGLEIVLDFEKHLNNFLKWIEA